MIGTFTPLIMFGLLLIGLAAGIPIAFALSSIALVVSYVMWGPQSLSLCATSAWGTMNKDPLIAIPLFIFMALVLEKSGVVGDLYDFFYKWSGPLRGGLAVATILSGTLIGAISGVIAAGVVGLGVIALPQMRKYKYDLRMSCGSVLAGGTLGQIVPPSINMVVYGIVAGVSVGGLFAGGVSCGLLLATLYIVYILISSYFQKHLCPALPLESRATWQEKFTSFKGLIAPLVLIIIVLGSIFSGAATPTEGAAVGAFGAIVISLATRRFSWSMIRESAIENLRVSSMVLWIIVGASIFGAVFVGVGGGKLVAEVVTEIPFGKWGALALSLVFVFFLGMFLETIAIIMIAVPVIAPIMLNLGFEPLWFGIVFNVALQSAYLSPPFGFALFYLKGVTPKDISIADIYWSSLPFMGLQILGLALILIFPQIAIWLPNMLGLGR